MKAFHLKKWVHYTNERTAEGDEKERDTHTAFTERLEGRGRQTNGECSMQEKTGGEKERERKKEIMISLPVSHVNRMTERLRENLISALKDDMCLPYYCARDE